MKNNIITILKKELKRFMGDKRLIITAVFLPGLMIYLMYNMMGSLMRDNFVVEQNSTYKVYAANMPDSISQLLKGETYTIDIIKKDSSEIEKLAKTQLETDTDLYVIFPEDFDKLTAEYDVTASNEPAPNVQLWYNSAKTVSQSAYSQFTYILSSYENTLANKFDINAAADDSSVQSHDLATDKDLFQSYIIYILPMLLIMFTFVGCQAIAPESIAGEKERGTLGTILVTPAKRSELALAKILSITIISMMSAVVSFTGLILSLPNLTQSENMKIDFYTISDYMMLFVVSISTVLVFVSILSILSAFSKSVKEATAYSMPIMIVSIICGLSSMITGGVPKEIYYYFIPVFNSAQCMTAIFKSEANIINILVTTGTNAGVMVLCTFILTKMFSNEKIVFDK